MEPAEIIARLNEDLTGEVEAILVYMNHHFILDDKGAELELLEIALDEMRHVQWLGEKIADLGGAPELTPRRLRFNGTDVKSAVSHAVMLEEEAIEGYRRHMEEIPDPKIKRMLNHIMEEEEDHHEKFTELLQELEAGGTEIASTEGIVIKEKKTGKEITVGDLTGGK